MRFRVIALIAILLGLPGLSTAGDVTFTQDFVAKFDFNLLGDTSINNGPATGYLPYEAVGSITFTLDAAINDPTKTTVAITNAVGSFTGVPPLPLGPFTISPNIQFLGGELTDIARDGSGHITSADVTNLSMQWELVAFGGAIVIYSDGGLPFNGTVHSIPFTNGDVLSGPDPVNGILPGTGEVVASVENRFLIAVPEPGTAVPAGLAVLALGAFLRRARRTRTP
jgi:hypothetical protein